MILRILLLLMLTATTHADDFELILQRGREVLLASPPAEQTIRKSTATLDAQGRWPDLDYADTRNAGWQPATALSRVANLLAAYHGDGPLADDAAVLAAANKALDDWVEHDYLEPQWWYRQIGVPRAMRDILLLHRDQLDDATRAFVLEHLRQHGLATLEPGKATGANLVWIAELSLIDSAIRKDADSLQIARDHIVNEIKQSEEEGIQPDFSFHQHGPRLQTFQYGASYLVDAARLAWLLRGTPWAVPQAKVDLLARYLIEGPAWQSRGRWTVPGTMDRAASRPGALDNGNLSGVARQLIDVASPELKPALQAYIDSQAKQTPAMQGLRFYPRSDFAAYHRPTFSVFIKTISTRTRTAEKINHENLRGELMNFGDWYFINDQPPQTQAYAEMPPVWDWHHLPGVVWAPDAGEPIRQPFSGGATLNGSGMLAADFAFGEGDTPKLAYARLWAFHDDTVVALIAPSIVNVEQAISMSLDQRRRVEDTVNGDGWLLHDRLLYLTPAGAGVEEAATDVTGRWRDINQSGPDNLIRERVFLPTATWPAFIASDFAVIGSVDADDADALARKRGFTVLANTPQVQAVQFSDGTLMAAFHDGGEVNTSLGVLKVNRACVLTISGDNLSAADPLQQGGELTVMLGDRPWKRRLPADGSVE